jgi:N-acetylneuraminic acid mutarotase
MHSARYYHTASLLSDGNVLVVGGNGSAGVERTTEIFDTSSGTWQRAGSIALPRRCQTATPLPNGTLIITGGDDGETPYASCELYDSFARSWKRIDSMRVNRTVHTATLLNNGMLLVVGGDSRQGSRMVTTSSCELYDLETEQWRPTGSLHVGRSNHTTVMLADGRVLVMGGTNDRLGELRSCEIYDPASETWSFVDSLSVPRAGHVTTCLSDGRVIVVGGYNSRNGRTYLSHCELFDPRTGKWRLSAPIPNPATTPTLTMLADGRLLLAGGFSMAQYPDYVYWSQCLIFNYASVASLGIDQERKAGAFLVQQGYPNPTSGATLIRYLLPESGPVSLKLYDAGGAEVATLVDGVQEGGFHEARFDAGGLHAGTYYLFGVAGGAVQTQALTVVH